MFIGIGIPYMVAVLGLGYALTLMQITKAHRNDKI